jgi:deazaflavin-dependent oxidoreductase (nitroreductase family)
VAQHSHLQAKDHGMNDQDTLTFNEKNITEFRSSHGRIASFGQAPLLLLTTIGARSGQPRTSPMMYLADDAHSNRVYVFASAAGDDKNPAWFHNLIGNCGPIEVEIGDDLHRASAEVLPEPQRTEIYPRKPIAIRALPATRRRPHA